MLEGCSVTVRAKTHQALCWAALGSYKQYKHRVLCHTLSLRAGWEVGVMLCCVLHTKAHAVGKQLLPPGNFPAAYLCQKGAVEGSTLPGPPREGLHKAGPAGFT